jgi:hypothetical protein
VAGGGTIVGRAAAPRRELPASAAAPAPAAAANTAPMGQPAAVGQPARADPAVLAELRRCPAAPAPRRSPRRVPP